MFQPFDGTPNYPELEKSVLKFWDEARIFDKLRAQNADGTRWDFQDGPITANNPMGVHHAWGRTYKDIFNRFHAMNGRRLRWQNGFDCQGLWVEVEVEKALGFKGKPDILAFGLEEFSRACRARVEKYAAIIIAQSERLGQWNDWERSYYTFDDSNIENIWLFLKTCHNEGWLAQDYRVMPWCPRCETSLSQHESADSYKDVTHKSVYVQLPISLPDGYKGALQNGDAFLAWTTTPWTLTANVALALNPELTYIRARSEERVLVLSKGAAKTALRPGYEVLDEISGRDLVDLEYSGPFDDIELQRESQEKAPRRVVAWEEVGEEEGTGIVHIAPACGAEDFELGKRENLGFIVPVDQSAHFLSGAGELAGLHALEDAPQVFEELRKHDRLYRTQNYLHSYPHCWRCDHELVFNAVREWFIKADAGDNPARPRLRAAAEKVEWIPDYAGKRMDDWLQNMGDWCISRKRFWGLPLPIWKDDETGEIEVIGSREELRERAVDPAIVDALPELHRPWIDNVELRSRGGLRVLRRVPEVGDAWLDAGIVPFSTVGYNDAQDIRMPELRIASPEDWQPADFITEMREQVRLWFFSMLFMGVALEDRAPYKRAMVYETMLDENAERISKTKKNGVPYDEAVETVGADPMRWTFCSNTLTKDIRFGYKPIHESARRLLTLWNVYSFFITYANLDKPELSDGARVLAAPHNVLDKWILARLQNVISDATQAVENTEPSRITRSIESFVEDLSTWYVRRSRRRFWSKSHASAESDADKAAAYSTLHHVLLTLSKVIAPVIPFSAEMMYRNLKAPLQDAPESVHLCAWPQVDETLRDEALLREVEGVLQCVSLGHAARKESGVKVRQPLSRVLVQAPSDEARRGIENWRDTILDELNAKDLQMLESAGDLVEYSLKANLPKLGKKLGKQMGAARAAFENASPDDARRIGEASTRGEDFTLQVGDETMTFAPDEVLVQTEQKSGYQFASENGWAVALDTQMTPELLDEGFARDFIRAVQSARKDADFQVSDHIAILASISENSRLPQVLESFGDLIQNETLADELRLVAGDYPELSAVKCGDETLHLRVELSDADEEV